MPGWLRRSSGWILRLVALAVVVVVLANQISWYDAIRLSDDDGTVLRGRVERAASGDWIVEPSDPDAERRVIPAADVAPREGSSGDVPDVSWGLRTLGERLTGHLGIVIAVLAILNALLWITAWRWRLLMRAVDLHLPLPRALRLTYIGSFFNAAIPGSTGGDVVKAYYAARATGRGTRAVISVFVDRVIGLIALAVFAGAVLFITQERGGYATARIVVLVVLGGALIGGIVLVVQPVRRVLGLGHVVRRLPFQKLIGEARAALRLYRGHPVALLTALGVSFFNHASAAVGVWLLAGALGIEGIELGTAMAFVPIANLFAAIPLLPGGWGVGELAFAWLFGEVGVPPTEAVGLSVVFRLGQLVVSLPGSALWLFWKGRPTKETIERQVQEAAERVQAQPGEVGEAGA